MPRAVARRARAAFFPFAPCEFRRDALLDLHRFAVPPILDLRGHLIRHLRRARALLLRIGENAEPFEANPFDERREVLLRLTTAWLEKLRLELVKRTYRPSPVLGVKIPKASGGYRMLGIPTVKDRVAQMAVYLVLMPIWEADFHPQSFGYRPKRSAHGAVEAIREGLRIGKTAVVDADLSKYFDTIPNRKLMREVAKRVSDGSVLALIRSWLRSPLLEADEQTGKRKLAARKCGTPQGSSHPRRSPLELVDWPCDYWAERKG